MPIKGLGGIVHIYNFVLIIMKIIIIILILLFFIIIKKNTHIYMYVLTNSH